MVTPYSARIKQSGIEYTIDIAALETPTCQSCGELLFSNHVDEQIRDALRGRPSSLAPSPFQAGTGNLAHPDREVT
jgi:hypothetical protein